MVMMMLGVQQLLLGRAGDVAPGATRQAGVTQEAHEQLHLQPAGPEQIKQ
jgi:hypothetical protein